jgi:hypothetical protein
MRSHSLAPSLEAVFAAFVRRQGFHSPAEEFAPAHADRLLPIAGRWALFLKAGRGGLFDADGTAASEPAAPIKVAIPEETGQ